MLKNFADFKNIFNIKILKCVGLIFSIKSLKENYANIILMAIIIFYFICLSMFVFKSYKKEIIFHIDIIVYFTLFPVKILYLVQRKEKKMRQCYYYYRNELLKKANITKLDVIMEMAKKVPFIRRDEYERLLATKQRALSY